MSLSKKLNLKSGMKLRVISKPTGVSLDDVATTSSAKAEGVLAFVKTLAEVDATCDRVVAAAREDRLAWIAYPKGGQLGTDLHRDVLWKHLVPRGIRGVRQVAIDDVWSALRFRPAK